MLHAIRLAKNGAFPWKVLAAALMMFAAFVVVAAPAALAAATFAPKADYDVGYGPFSVAAADLDGDGDQDLATANERSDNVSVLTNSGGAFAQKTNYDAGNSPQSVAAADLDDDGDPDLVSANFDSGTVSVLRNSTGPRADLSITQSDSADPATVGEDLTYTLTVTNSGPATATNTVITDKLPSGFEFVSTTVGQGTCSESGGTVTCALGTLARNATVMVEIGVAVTDSAASEVSNVASVQSGRVDFDQADNSAAETTAINRAPTATGDSYTTEEDRTLRIPAPGILSNDTDADGGSLTAEVLTDPEHGTLFLRSNGSFSYFPDSGYTGTDSFTYELSDGKGGTDTATVSLTVNAAAKAPTLLRTSPTNGATGSSRTANVTAAFSEKLKASTVNASTVKVVQQRNSSATLVTARVSLSADGKTVTIDPAATLAKGALYKVTIKGGPGGVQSEAGKPLEKDVTFAFKTGSR